MVMLAGREKTEVADADVAVGWMLLAGAAYCWREREKADVVWLRGRERIAHHWNQPDDG
jgi:hypothetical protein